LRFISFLSFPLKRPDPTSPRQFTPIFAGKHLDFAADRGKNKGHFRVQIMWVGFVGKRAFPHIPSVLAQRRL
jgi:hypothetical protein